MLWQRLLLYYYMCVHGQSNISVRPYNMQGGRCEIMYHIEGTVAKLHTTLIWEGGCKTRPILSANLGPIPTHIEHDCPLTSVTILTRHPCIEGIYRYTFFFCTLVTNNIKLGPISYRSLASIMDPHNQY